MSNKFLKLQDLRIPTMHIQGLKFVQKAICALKHAFIHILI